MTNKIMKKISISDLPIKYFKMVSGESIIAYVHEATFEDGAVIALEEPMLVIMSEDFDYHFVPWFPFSINRLHYVDTYNILCEDTVIDDIKKTYMKLVLDRTDSDNAIDDIDDPVSSTVH